MFYITKEQILINDSMDDKIFEKVILYRADKNCLNKQLHFM